MCSDLARPRACARRAPRARWTLRELAERSGVSVRFLVQLEAGRGNISVKRLADLARRFDVTAADLLRDDRRRRAPRRRAARPARRRQDHDRQAARAAAARPVRGAGSPDREGGRHVARGAVLALRRGPLPPAGARDAGQACSPTKRRWCSPPAAASSRRPTPTRCSKKHAVTVWLRADAGGPLEPRRPPGRSAADGGSSAGDGGPARAARRARAALRQRRPHRRHVGPPRRTPIVDDLATRSSRTNLIMNFVATTLFCLWSLAAAAQGLAPNTTYDPAIPTLESVIGHAPATRSRRPTKSGATSTRWRRPRPIARGW